jgi:DNA ligase-1
MIPKSLKPMLAVQCELDKLKFPLIASAKLDGIRCLIIDGKAYSRNLKLIPNDYVQYILGWPDNNGLDGELIVGNAYDPDVYRNTNSGVMSKDGQPDVKFHVFDRWDRVDLGFRDRYKLLPPSDRHIVRVPHSYIVTMENLLKYEEATLNLGYEGLMLRNPDGPYKYGRSTLKEGTLLKLKRFTDAEALILHYEELYSNQNEATKDALGHTERSSHKAGLVPQGTLGALVVRDLVTGVEFNIGSGFTAEDRADIWANREAYSGRIVKYKSFSIGVKDKPRFPTFLGFRDPIDL